MIPSRPATDAWSAPLRWLHWLVAGLVLLLLGLGIAMVHAPMAVGTRFELYQLHKSLGLTLLVLMPVRLALRLHGASPAPHGPAWRRRTARIVQALFYLLLVALPLSGWVSASASSLRVPIRWFDLFPVPALAAPDRAMESTAARVHLAAALFLAALVVLHVAAALRHHVIDRDDTLRRMWKGRA